VSNAYWKKNVLSFFLNASVLEQDCKSSEKGIVDNITGDSGNPNQKKPIPAKYMFKHAKNVNRY